MSIAEIRFHALIRRLGQHGEKTGWTVIDLPAALASVLHEKKTAFKLKGTLDGQPVAQLAAIPIGEGHYVVPLDGVLRKKMGLRTGLTVACHWQRDDHKPPMDEVLMECLQDAPKAWQVFQKLPPSHQRYYSNWVASAKTDETKSKRIAKCIAGLEKDLDFGATTRLA